VRRNCGADTPLALIAGTSLEIFKDGTLTFSIAGGLNLETVEASSEAVVIGGTGAWAGVTGRLHLTARSDQPRHSALKLSMITVISPLLLIVMWKFSWMSRLGVLPWLIRSC
jgi:RsiW-degrading membrane proteinase PrsW (M82 family)